MFRKKPIYIVGIVLFTLILVADLALAFLAPTVAVGRGNMPNMEDFEGQMPNMGDFDPSGFSGQMPDMGDFDPGGFSGQMPDMGDFDPSSFGSSDADRQRPQRGEMPGGGRDFTLEEDSSAQGGLVTTVRSAFWPILIGCVLGDGLCIVMLIRLSRKEASEEEGPEEDDTRPRRDRSNLWLALIALVLVGAVVMTSLPSGEVQGGMETEVSIESWEVGFGDVVSSFSGSGTLESSTGADVQIPATVTVTAYTVKNGQQVTAGDVIAQVDQNSVLKALYEVQTLLDELDAELLEVQDDTLDSTVTTQASGRVKAIYAEEGGSVAGTMAENGALVLISLGGSMTVVVESEAEVAVGQSLVVTLSDGTEIEGKVQETANGKITVTTTDDGPTPGDGVSVAAEDGTLLGSGTLEISSPLKITGYSGTVNRIRVKVNQKVNAGTTLLTLKDTQDLARYQKLLQDRETLTGRFDQLAQMCPNGCIRAESSGVVSQISSDAVYAETASGTGSYGVMLLSDGPDFAPGGENAPSGQPGETLTAGTYAGKVSKVTYGGLYVQLWEQDVTGTTAAALETMSETLFTAEKQFAPSLEVTVNQYLKGQLVPSTIDAIQADDKVLLYLADGAITQIDFIAAAKTNIIQQMPSGGSFGGASAWVEEDEELAVYEVETTSLCTIIPAETMTIQVSVDELDILSLAVGQETAITLDALPGQSFTGSVQRISPVGTAEDGGSTKYTVTMEVPRTAQMLDGMNASVRIEVGRLEQVLRVPAAAVCEDGNRTYVYTALDSETGEPGSPVDVTTGASDGSYIEILSGLTQGDVVYYEYAGSVSYKLSL